MKTLLLVCLLALSASAVSFVRFGHFVPGGPAVDITAGGGPVAQFQNISYPAVSPYISVEPGTTNVKIAAGSVDIINDNVDVMDGVQYSVLAIGNTSGPYAGLILPDVQSATPPTAASYYLRGVHVAPNAGVVNLTITASVLQMPIVIPLAYTNFTPYAELPAGVPINVTITNSSGAVIYNVTGLTPNPNAYYSAFAHGDTGSTTDPFTVLISQDDVETPAAANVYGAILHADPAVGGVDVLIGDGSTPQVTNLMFKQRTGFVNFAGASDTRVRVFATGDYSAAVIDSTFDFSAGGQFIFAAAAGDNSTVDLVGLATDPMPPAANKAHLRFAHFIQNAPPVKVVSGGVDLIPVVGFTNYSDYVEIDAGVEVAYEIQTADGTSVFNGTVELVAGTSATLYALGNDTSDADFSTLMALDGYNDGYVRFLHANPLAPLVDIVVGEGLSPAYTNVAFTNITDYVASLPIATRVRVFAAGTLVDPVVDTVVTPTVMTQFTAAVNGLNLTDVGAQVFTDDVPTPGANDAGIRFVHLVANAPAVKVVVGNTTLFDLTSYGNATPYIVVPAMTYEVEVQTAGNATVLSANLTLEAEKIYSVFALGNLTNLLAKVTVDPNFYPMQMGTPTPTAANNTPTPTVTPEGTTGGMATTGSATTGSATTGSATTSPASTLVAATGLVALMAAMLF